MTYSFRIIWKRSSLTGRIPGHFVADWIEWLLILFLPLSHVHLMRYVAVPGLWLWRFPILLLCVGESESWWSCAVRMGTAGKSTSVNTLKMNWTKSWMGWMKVPSVTFFFCFHFSPVNEGHSLLPFILFTTSCLDHPSISDTTFSRYFISVTLERNHVLNIEASRCAACLCFPCVLCWSSGTKQNPPSRSWE